MHARFLAVWFASVLVLTLSPFGPMRSPLPFSWIDPTNHRLGLFDFYANVLLFLPLGVFAPGRLTKRGTVILGIGFSMLIETAQAHIVGRNPSAWDLMANSLGTGLGVFWSASLIEIGNKIYTRPVRITVLFGGMMMAIYFTKNYGMRPRFFHMLPFSYGVLGSLVGCSIFPHYLACGLCWVAVLGLCGPAVAPLDTMWILSLSAGAILGAWPFERHALTADSTAPTLG